MSRRKKPRQGRDERCKLICTDQGQHKPTFLGWIRFIAGDELPRSPHDPPEPDELQFLESAPHARANPGELPREWDIVSNFDEHERMRDGHRGLESERRERWQLAATCPRCPGNVPVKGEHLAPIVREAIRTGVFEVDVSRIRGQMH